MVPELTAKAVPLRIETEWRVGSDQANPRKDMTDCLAELDILTSGAAQYSELPLRSRQRQSLIAGHQHVRLIIHSRSLD
jgi:hypothetical protein